MAIVTYNSPSLCLAYYAPKVLPVVGVIASIMLLYVQPVNYVGMSAALIVASPLLVTIVAAVVLKCLCTQYFNAQLFRAISEENLVAVRQLFHAGVVHCEVRNDAGQTPLAVCAFEMRLFMMDFLLNQRASLKATDPQGNTPLLLAAQAGYLGVCQRLVRAGADMRARNHQGQTALDIAERSSVTEIPDFLRANMPDQYGRYPIFQAIYDGAPDRLREILKYANLEVETGDGSTPLLEAITTSLSGNLTRKRLECVRLLLAAGVNLQVQDSGGDGPLACAVYGLEFDMVVALIDAGASLDERNKKTGDTPLLLAAGIPGGAEGEAAMRQLAIVRLLVEKGADMRAINHQGQTALDIAEHSHAVPVFNFLRASMPDQDGVYPIFHAIQAKNLPLLTELVANHVSLEVKDSEGCTPILAAINSPSESFRLAAVEFLANSGANLRCRDPFGNGVIACAINQVDPLVTQLLIERGAPVNVQNNEGETPLDLIRAETAQCMLGVLAMLEAALLGETIN